MTTQYTPLDVVEQKTALTILGVTKGRLGHLVADGEVRTHPGNRHTSFYDRRDLLRIALEIVSGKRKTHSNRTQRPDIELARKKGLDMRGYVNTEDARQIAGCTSANYMCQLAREGRIKAVKVGRMGWFFDPRDVIRYRDAPSNTGRPRGN